MRKLSHDKRPPARASRLVLDAFIRRRGVAMLLVVITVMAATILSISYLSSRDNSLAISENSIKTSEARWAALSGIDVALAVLQTESNWRTIASDGVLLENYPFLGGELTVHIYDADTGTPPTADTVLVDLVATVNGSGGMEHKAQAFAAVSTPTEGLFQLDLADFAIFANHSIRLNSGAFVGRWETAPRTRFGLPIPIGVRAINPSSIQVISGASVINAKVHHQEDAPSSIVDASQGMERVGMKDVIPLPAAPSSNEDHPGSGNGHMNLDANVVLVNQLVWDQITVQPGRRVRIPNDPTVVVGDDLTLSQNSRIIVEGNATLVVFGDVTMQPGSYIEIVPGATLRMYVAGDVDLDEAYIGRERADKSLRDTSGSATWMDPGRIQLLGFGDSDTTWDIDDTSVVKASIYAPRAEVIVDDGSAVYGRIAGRRVRIRNNSALYYDHSLDHFAGYTNAKSILFDGDGNILPVFRDMETIDPPQLSDVADAVGTQFRAFAISIGTPGSLYDFDVISIGDPTPRPIAVEYQLLSVGIEPRDWEQAGP